MRKKLVAGNWKMHGSRSMADGLVREIVQAKDADIDVLVCPPFPYLATLAATYAGSGVGFGAQDVSEHEGQGAYTGEVAAAMVADVGAQWTLVGHSERRHYHHESNEQVARKFAAARAAGLTPILCVGETRRNRNRDRPPAPGRALPERHSQFRYRRRRLRTGLGHWHRPHCHPPASPGRTRVHP
jgi:triosephosphate isomerase (TIM)